MQHFKKYDLVPLLSILAVAAFPCFFLYARNCDQVPASSMIPFLLVFSITGLAIMALSGVFFRNVSRAAFFADLSLLVVINFCLVSENLKKLLPFLRDRYLFLVLGLLLLVLFILLIKKKPDMRTGCILVCIAFGSMIIINLFLAIPTMITTTGFPADHGRPRQEAHGGPGGGHRPNEHPSVRPDGPPQPQETVEFGPDRPNVYYFIFDEYGGYENLLHYYEFDNSPFLEELEVRGFSVARSSLNSEAVETVTIIPNLLNLNYLVDRWSPYQKKLDHMDKTYMARLFRDNGYQIQLVNHVDFLGRENGRALTKNQTRRTISEILMRNSLFNKSLHLRKLLDDFFVIDYGANYRASLDNALEMGLKSWETAQDTPTLTIGYIQCPHSPTMVGPHGEHLPFEYGWNWLDHSLYLGQVEFINSYILEFADTIIENDPNAMIILQSDHGNRYAIHMMQMNEWDTYDPYVHNPLMQNILNCVYYQGRSFPIEGETGINTLRMMFREVLGADLPAVEPIVDFSMGYRDEVQ